MFAQNVLPKLCSHSNISSFIRQLNMYHFKKRSLSFRTETMSYCHPCFVRDKPELLRNIVRKNPRQSMKNNQNNLKGHKIGLKAPTPSSNIQQQVQEVQEIISDKNQNDSQQPDLTGGISEDIVLRFMDQLIDHVSSRCDQRTRSLIQDYLKDDEEDEEIASAAQKKVKPSPAEESSSQDRNVPDFDPTGNSQNFFNANRQHEYSNYQQFELRSNSNLPDENVFMHSVLPDLYPIGYNSSEEDFQFFESFY